MLIITDYVHDKYNEENIWYDLNFSYVIIVVWNYE